MAMKRYKNVDCYFDELESWIAEVKQLRGILNSTELVETLKWSIPTYTHQGKNVVGIASFKNHFGLWFFQGAQLKDEKNILTNAQEGKTKAMRHWKMDSKADIKTRQIKAFVKEAMQFVEEGKQIKPNLTKPVVIPPELTSVFSKQKKAAKQFGDLSKSKQREFADYISSAKRAETKLKRIEKILPMILDGVGLNDKYR